MTTDDNVVKETCVGCGRIRLCLVCYNIGVTLYLCEKCIANLKEAYQTGLMRYQSRLGLKDIVQRDNV